MEIIFNLTAIYNFKGLYATLTKPHKYKYSQNLLQTTNLQTHKQDSQSQNSNTPNDNGALSLKQ